MPRGKKESDGEHDEGRLSPLQEDKDLLPWRRATELKHCALYWLPVQQFPASSGQKKWMEVFFLKLSARMKKDLELRSEDFLQAKIVPDHLMNKFLNLQFQLNPMIGLTRRPGAEFPRLPDMENDVKPMQEGKKTFDINEYMPDYAYWFLGKQEKKQKEAFLGFGGLTTIFLKPDPKTEPPPLAKVPPSIGNHKIFKQLLPDVEPERFQEQTYALLDDFLPKSKEMFGKGLEEDPQFPGILYILPLLQTKDFFAAAKDEIKEWFDLFDIYINESPEDKGIVMGSKEDLDEVLIELVEEMRDEEFVYPAV
jgi:hypothetical protein